MTADRGADRELGSAGLMRWVAEHDIAAELIRPGAPTPTVAAAAEALGTDVGHIVKSLLFLADAEPVLVVAAGESRISSRTLAAVLGVSRRRLRFASSAQALDITGYQIGALPPFGHRSRLPTLIDSATVPERGTVYGGGGSRDTLLRLSVSTLYTATGGRSVTLTEGPL